MEIQSVFDNSFSVYGKVLQGYDFEPLIAALETLTPKPKDEVVYVPSDPDLEEMPCFKDLENRFYGGMPLQVGYCNGSNTKLNCLEYHRDSEVNIPADDIILLVAKQQDFSESLGLDTSKIEAFHVPNGTPIELYATTLHFAPCENKIGIGFRVVVILPKGTNTLKPDIQCNNFEDRLLWAKNKWLISHPDSTEATQGAFIGLTGENIDMSRYL